MIVKLYMLPGSTSSRTARKFLDERNIDYEEQSMVSKPLTWEQLFEILMHTENGVSDILSTRSMVYKELVRQGIDFDDLTLTELHYAIRKHPSILRSPIVVSRGSTLVGYSEENMKTMLDRKGRKENRERMLAAIRLEEERNPVKYRYSKYDTAI